MKPFLGIFLLQLIIGTCGTNSFAGELYSKTRTLDEPDFKVESYFLTSDPAELEDWNNRILPIVKDYLEHWAKHGAVLPGKRIRIYLAPEAGISKAELLAAYYGPNALNDVAALK